MNIEEISSILQLVVVIGTLIGSVWRVTKPFRAISSRLEALEEFCHNDYLSTLRLTILNDDVPITERLAAGEKYVKEGGNGAVKVRYHMLQEEYEHQQEEKEE